MAVRRKLRGILRDRRGNSAVEFIFTTAMLILLVAVLISALVYISQYFNASFITRRVVRTIEICGKYDEQEIRTLTDELGGATLENLSVTVDANYLSGRKIQLKDSFTVRLSAIHRIQILTLGSSPVSVDLPIRIRLSGRSEVYWK